MQRTDAAAIDNRPVLPWRVERERLVLIGVFAVLCALFLVLAPHFAFFADVGIYAYWGLLTRTHFFHVYSVGAANSNWWLRPNYGPVAMYIFVLCESAWAATASILGLSTSLSVPENGTLTTFMKVPELLAHLGTIALLYTIGRRVMRPRWALVAVLTYAFAPGMLIDVMMWGQSDALIILGVMLALFQTERLRGIWVGVFFALAVSVKPQPIIFLPVAIVYLYRWGGPREAARVGAGFVGASLLVWLPYVFPPRPEVLVWKQMLAVLANERPYSSDGALNLWWLLGSLRNPAKPFIGPITPNLLGASVLVVFLLIALASIWRDGSPARLWLGCGLVAVAFFVVMTMQRERYYLPAPAILLVAAMYDRRYWLLYGAAAFAVSFNVAQVFAQPPVVVGAALSAWGNGLIARYASVYEAVCIGTAGINLWLLITLAVFQLRSRTIHPQPGAQLATAEARAMS
jgi:Glycosyltransferase family 87